MSAAPILVTGASGQLGAYLLHEARRSGKSVAAWSGAQGGVIAGMPLTPVDLTDPAQTTAAFHAAAPRVVIHAAAVASIAECHRDPARARRVNVEATAHLVQLAAQTGARLLLVSTDLVFDGARGRYREDDPPAPLSEYGRTKATAERAVLAYPQHAVVRVSLLFGPSRNGRVGFFDQQREALRAGKAIQLFEDEWRSPLGLHSAAAGLLALAESGFGGLLHFAGPERLSRLAMGQRLARHLGLDPAAVTPTRRDANPAPEPRPCDVSLDSTRWRQLFPQQPRPTYEKALAEMLAE